MCDGFELSPVSCALIDRRLFRRVDFRQLIGLTRFHTGRLWLAPSRKPMLVMGLGVLKVYIVALPGNENDIKVAKFELD